jgi:hypothetical protein
MHIMLIEHRMWFLGGSGVYEVKSVDLAFISLALTLVPRCEIDKFWENETDENKHLTATGILLCW